MIRKRFKKFVIGAAALTMTFSSVLVASAATGTWEQNETGWRWKNSSSTYVASEWVEDGTGWYHLSGTTYMNTDWFQDGDGTWYYLNPISDGTKGKMATGWVLDGSTWYFTNSSGAMLTGLVNVAGKVYYLNPVSDGTKGAMQTGSVTIGGNTYTFDADGAAYGTIPTTGAKYNSNGTKITSTTSSSSSSGGGGKASTSSPTTAAAVSSTTDTTTGTPMGTTTVTIEVNNDGAKTLDALYNQYITSYPTEKAALDALILAHGTDYTVNVTVTFGGTVIMSRTGTLDAAKASADAWKSANGTEVLDMFVGGTCTVTVYDNTNAVYGVYVINVAK